MFMVLNYGMYLQLVHELNWDSIMFGKYCSDIVMSFYISCETLKSFYAITTALHIATTTITTTSIPYNRLIKLVFSFWWSEFERQIITQ
jgi:hypothetical protein